MFKRIQKTSFYFIVIILLLCILLCFSLSVGSVSIPFADLFLFFKGTFDFLFSGLADTTTGFATILDLRLSRSILALIVGAALGASGAAFQGIFGNPLADPHVIGTSSGSSLGAVIAIVLGFNFSIPGVSAIGICAFLGGFIAAALAYAIAHASRQSAIAILLSGSVLGTLFSSLVSLMLTLNDHRLTNAYFWILGGFSGKGWSSVFVSAPSVLIAIIILSVFGRVIDILSLGDEEAKALGVNPVSSRILIGLFATLATSASVAVSGAIGFIGLVSPHICRYFVGARNRLLIPASALTGAFLVLGADIAARTLFKPIEVPVGVFTAMFGVPFFLALLASKGRALK